MLAVTCSLVACWDRQASRGLCRWGAKSRRDFASPARPHACGHVQNVPFQKYHLIDGLHLYVCACGAQVIPWLELLDLKKWSVAAVASAQPKSKGRNLAALSTEQAAAPPKSIGVTPAPTSHVTLFAFPLLGGSTLNIRRYLFSPDLCVLAVGCHAVCIAGMR